MLPPHPSQVPYLVELGGLNLYPIAQQLPWVAPGLPEGSFVIVIFSGVSGQVGAGLYITCGPGGCGVKCVKHMCICGLGLASAGVV